MSAGYSGTPLAKKLTLKDGNVCWFQDMPSNIAEEISEFDLSLELVAKPQSGLNAAHIFVTEEDQLTKLLASLTGLIARDGQIWVSWPKKGSGKETALDQAAVQRTGLASGLVDTKKCAVDEIWSGMKFVIPKADR